MKAKMGYEEALALASQVMETLRPGCERIEIAGSLRRKKAEIGDIELVAIPKMGMAVDLFGSPVVGESLLDLIIGDKYSVIKGDKKYKQLDLGACACDLFIQPDRGTWGVNMMIRTGSAEFSKWMVTSRNQGGAMPGWMRMSGARLWATGQKVLETPEEVDVFRAMGLRWIAPEERIKAFWGEIWRFLLPGERPE